MRIELSAMDMVMILREDKAKMVDKFEEKRSVANINTATGDEFLYRR
jgi:hypothetical protein